MPRAIRSPKIIYNTLRYNYLMRKKSIVSASDSKLLEDVLDKYSDHATVFVHIGLSQIKSAFGGDPYGFIMENLTKRFDIIIAPGFTPSFRGTRLYHKKYSKPEYGMFSWLFLNDITYRTDDPVYSLLVHGKYEFENRYSKETFGEGSCFDQLDNDNILCLNIGTKWAVSSQIHFSEYKNMVPYITKTQYNGIIYYDEHQHNTISVVNYVNNYWFNKYVSVIWNRYKISRHLCKEGILDYYDLDGVKVYAFKLKDLRVFLDKKLSKDPYYLLS